jgi:TonB family protein
VRQLGSVWTFALFLALLGSPGAYAQTPMEQAAARLVGPIVHTKQKIVAVFDFSGPGNQVTSLGAKLADDLSVALAKSSQELQLIDRSQIEERREKDFYAPDIVLDSPLIFAFADELKAKALVLGTISLGPDNRISIDLRPYRVSDGKGIDGVRVSFPLSPEMAGLMVKKISLGNAAEFLNYPKGGAAGYTSAKCIKCPRADYTEMAMRQRVQGMVVLYTVVGIDGRVDDIAVVKGLPGGLTAAAINAVKRWQLKPATGPDGKPAATREIIEVVFQRF